MVHTDCRQQQLLGIRMEGNERCSDILQEAMLTCVRASGIALVRDNIPQHYVSNVFSLTRSYRFALHPETNDVQSGYLTIQVDACKKKTTHFFFI